jgi:uncharacterized protein YneR
MQIKMSDKVVQLYKEDLGLTEGDFMYGKLILTPLSRDSL